MSISKNPYVRCFWPGALHLIDGTIMPVRCTHISKTMTEIEAPSGLHASKLVFLELNASHRGANSLLKILCDPLDDIINEHDQHYIRLSFHTISDQDALFIEHFIHDHN
ncbi:hypothetical protein [Marinomonas epiphytica]